MSAGAGVFIVVVSLAPWALLIAAYVLWRFSIVWQR